MNGQNGTDGVNGTSIVGPPGAPGNGTIILGYALVPFASGNVQMEVVGDDQPINAYAIAFGTRALLSNPTGPYEPTDGAHAWVVSHTSILDSFAFKFFYITSITFPEGTVITVQANVLRATANSWQHTLIASALGSPTITTATPQPTLVTGSAQNLGITIQAGDSVVVTVGITTDTSEIADAFALFSAGLSFAETV
jgi:hypothetical protein